MNVTSEGIDTGVSEAWIDCAMIVDAPTSDSNKRSALVYINGRENPGVYIEFVWACQGTKLKAGERHTMALVQASPKGTLLLKQLSTAGQLIDILAN
jgi:hypothetical protein